MPTVTEQLPYRLGLKSMDKTTFSGTLLLKLEMEFTNSQLIRKNTLAAGFSIHMSTAISTVK